MRKRLKLNVCNNKKLKMKASLPFAHYTVHHILRLSLFPICRGSIVSEAVRNESVIFDLISNNLP